MEFSLPLRVYMEDTDIGGIVYYVNYLKFMERARTELLRTVGYRQAKLKAEGLIFVVHSVTCRYSKPATLDDELTVKTVIKRLSPVAIEFDQRVEKASDQTLLCRAEVKIASVQADSIKPTRLPAAMVDRLMTYVNV